MPAKWARASGSILAHHLADPPPMAPHGEIFELSSNASCGVGSPYLRASTSERAVTASSTADSA
jgi:hypothetical protein